MKPHRTYVPWIAVALLVGVFIGRFALPRAADAYRSPADEPLRVTDTQTMAVAQVGISRGGASSDWEAEIGTVLRHLDGLDRRIAALERGREDSRGGSNVASDVGALRRDVASVQDQLRKQGADIQALRRVLPR